MMMRRMFRRWVSGTLVLAVLFTQLATAAYACPSSMGSDEPQTAPAMPCAQMLGASMTLDPEQPGLCQQHCQFGNTQQAGDPVQALALPVVLLAFPRIAIPGADSTADLAAWADHERRREPAPPHSILHCCLRF
jgi:hypothetical protein